MSHLKGRRLYPELNQQTSEPTSQVSQPTTKSNVSNPFMTAQSQAQPQQTDYNQNTAQSHYPHQNQARPQDPYASDRSVGSQSTGTGASSQVGSRGQSYPQTAPQKTSSDEQDQAAYNQKPAPTKKKAKKSQIDTDKIPRPEFNPESSYAPKHYQTSSNLNPPPSFWNYITSDEGNAGPRFARASFYKVPAEASLLNNTHVPLGLILQPFADPTADEEPVPIVNYGEAGPLRCTRCRAYVSPHWIWTQGGAKVICNLCKMTNTVPQDYYCPIDSNGVRTDKYEKPELCKGVYEFVAPSTYSSRPPVTSNILICLEISSYTYLSGIFHQVMSSLQSLLDYFPSPELTKICIATYDNALNLFMAPNDLLKEPTLITIPEIDDACFPYPVDALFLNVKNDREKIDYLIQKITQYYEKNEKLAQQKGVYATCFGAALNSCCFALLQDGGRILIFSSQSPVNGVGKLKKRDDRSLFGTDKEKTLFVPQIEDYERVGKICLEKRICIDLFCFAQDYFDLATIGQVCNLTGGNIYYYPNYNGVYDGEKVHYDLSRNLTRYVGYDVVMTVRTSQGLAFSDYILPSGRRPVPELEFAALDADNAFAVYLKHEDKLPDEDDACIQAAVLYTSPYGERLIRVINLKLNTSKDIVTVFRSCDVEAVSQLLIKRYLLQLSTHQTKTIRDNLIQKMVDILYNYRIHCASSSSPAQLILPESLKVMPIYVFAVLKAAILRMGLVKPDERLYDFHRFMRYPCNVLSNLWYPKIYPLHSIFERGVLAPGSIQYESQRIIVGTNIPATDEKIDDDGIYLIDNNDTIYLYVKRLADPYKIMHLFAVETFEEVSSITSMPQSVETDFCERVNNIIETLRRYKNASYQPVRIVAEGDPIEKHLLDLLFEDDRLGVSYATFLCDVHKMIQDRYN